MTDPPSTVREGASDRAPTRDELYAAIAERNLEQHRADTRVRRWFWVRVAGYCWLWALVGLVLGAFAFRVTDVELGKILLLSGQVVTIAGVLGTIGYAVVESERRGWL